MKAFIVVVDKLPAYGMAIFPFILIKTVESKGDKILLNHEKIHLRQQLELLILPFYLLYLISYLFNRLKYTDHHTAYRNIIFEKEAFNNEGDLAYLARGNWFGWLSVSR